MESTDKEAINRYYGESREEEEEEEKEEEKEEERILEVENIANTVIFISFLFVNYDDDLHSCNALKQPLYVGVNSILIEPLKAPI